MKSNLKIYTTYVSERNLSRCLDLNILPIFIMRKIYNSSLIGKFSETAIHFPELAPSNELFHEFKNNEKSLDDYFSDYKNELVEGADLEAFIHRLELLAKTSNASGIALVTYGRDIKSSTRKVLADLLNESGMLEEKIYEIG